MIGHCMAGRTLKGRLLITCILLCMLPAIERTWARFCALLGTRFGQIDPDTEFWDQLKDLKQGSLPAAQYVHKMQYCFNGITDVAYLRW